MIDLTTAARVVTDLTIAACGGFLGGLLALELLKRVPVTAPKPTRQPSRSPMERELSTLPSERFDIGDELYTSLPSHAYPHWYVSIVGFDLGVTYVLFHEVSPHAEVRTSAVWNSLGKRWYATQSPPSSTPKYVLDCVTKQLVGVLPPT